jgi:nicotinate-nucleotide pyrophosphorylase (carboxylating)
MPDPGSLPKTVSRVAQTALDEDMGSGDVTTFALIDDATVCEAEIRFRSGGVVACVPLAEAVFRLLDVNLTFRQLVAEGREVKPDAVVARASGRAKSILSGERTALNFVARFSGVATLTARFVKAVEGTGALILDTRKTMPGLREYDKYAVRAGGGTNHRMDLSAAVLVKDNHLAVIGLSPAEAVRRAKARVTSPVEVEVETLDQALAAARAGADIIMLDNFDPAGAKKAVAALRSEFPKSHRDAPAIEVSGGVTLENVRAFAEAGADRISIGALTHSAPALDVTLDVRPLPR